MKLKYYYLLCLVPLVLVSCLRIHYDGSDERVAQIQLSHRSPIKAGTVVNVRVSWTVPEFIFDLNRTRRSEVLTPNHTVYAFICGTCRYRLYPYRNAYSSEYENSGFAEPSDPKNYPIPPMAELINIPLDVNRVPNLIPATYNPNTYYLETNLSVKLLLDSAAKSPYVVEIAVGFVVFPKDVEAKPENWKQATSFVLNEGDSQFFLVTP